MYRARACMVAVASFLAVSLALLAQDSGQSLGDLARKEHERQQQETKSGPHAKRVYTNEDLRPAEAGRPENVQHVRFVDLQIGADRPGADYFVFVPAQPKVDLCRDQCAREPECKAFAYVDSKKPGSRPVCHLKSAVTPPVPDGITISGVKVTLGKGHATARSGKAAKLPGAGDDKAEEAERLKLLDHLSPNEARALYNLQIIGQAEGFCRKATDVYIALEDLESIGCVGRRTRAPLRRDLLEDPNYEYTVAIEGDEIAINASPRHGGIGGFFSDATEVFYNPSGPASDTDTLIATHEALKSSPEFRKVSFEAVSTVMGAKK